MPREEGRRAAAAAPQRQRSAARPGEDSRHVGSVSQAIYHHVRSGCDSQRARRPGGMWHALPWASPAQPAARPAAWNLAARCASTAAGEWRRRGNSFPIVWNSSTHRQVTSPPPSLAPCMDDLSATQPLLPKLCQAPEDRSLPSRFPSFLPHDKFLRGDAQRALRHASPKNTRQGSLATRSPAAQHFTSFIPLFSQRLNLALRVSNNWPRSDRRSHPTASSLQGHDGPQATTTVPTPSPLSP